MPNNDQWQDVPTATPSTGDDGWTDVPTVAPKKQGFKRSLRAGFGLKPEGSLSDDISQIGEGFRQMYHHPFTSANDLVEGLWSSQEDVARKGAARMTGSDRLIDRVSGVAQGLESFVPGVGPILSRMGEQIEGDDYAGAAGTGLPLVAAMDTAPARGMIGDVMRTPGGAVKPAPRLATEIGAAAAGHEMLPYAGGYIGWKAGAPLSEMITPAKTPKTFPGARPTPWEAPVEPAPATPAASEATQTLRGSKTLFDVPGATSSAPGPGAARGPEGPLAKPRLSAQETSEYLKSKGRSAGRLSEDIDAADAGRTKENLSPYMQKKIGEAEGAMGAEPRSSETRMPPKAYRARYEKILDDPSLASKGVYIKGDVAVPLGGKRTYGFIDQMWADRAGAESALGKIKGKPGFENARVIDNGTPGKGNRYRYSLEWGERPTQTDNRSMGHALGYREDVIFDKPSGPAVGGPERRVNPGLRAATGPDPVRQSLVREAQRVIDDPKSTARDKRIAQDQIADIQAHPFEGAKGQDFVKESRAGRPKMTRKEAESASEKRSPGRKKRLSEEMGND